MVKQKQLEQCGNIIFYLRFNCKPLLIIMNKLLRSRKQFGRCSVEGHGQNCHCEVNQEIQSKPFTRAQDKRELKKEITESLK